MTKALVPVFVNSKCKTNSRPASGPWGENFQFCAACMAILAMYWLDGVESNSAPTTLPEESTLTLMFTRRVPRIVFFAVCGTSGKTCRTTALSAGPPSVPLIEPLRAGFCVSFGRDVAACDSTGGEGTGWGALVFLFVKTELGDVFLAEGYRGSGFGGLGCSAATSTDLVSG